jgi:hypothetical protein
MSWSESPTKQALMAGSNGALLENAWLLPILLVQASERFALQGDRAGILQRQRQSRSI